MPPADVTAIRAAIMRGQNDVLATDIMPCASVARLVGAATVSDEGPPAERAVVWSHAARDVFVGCAQGLSATDPSAATTFAARVDRTARDLGHAAVGVSGLLPHTYEKAVPETSFVLSFELVTWTKAGEVIAILHLFEAPRDMSQERPLWR